MLTRIHQMLFAFAVIGTVGCFQGPVVDPPIKDRIDSTYTKAQRELSELNSRGIFVKQLSERLLEPTDFVQKADDLKNENSMKQLIELVGAAQITLGHLENCCDVYDRALRHAAFSFKSVAESYTHRAEDYSVETSKLQILLNAKGWSDLEASIPSRRERLAALRGTFGPAKTMMKEFQKFANDVEGALKDRPYDGPPGPEFDSQVQELRAYGKRFEEYRNAVEQYKKGE